MLFAGRFFGVGCRWSTDVAQARGKERIPVFLAAISQPMGDRRLWHHGRIVAAQHFLFESRRSGKGSKHHRVVELSLCADACMAVFQGKSHLAQSRCHCGDYGRGTGVFYVIFN